MNFYSKHPVKQLHCHWNIFLKITQLLILEFLKINTKYEQFAWRDLFMWQTSWQSFIETKWYWLMLWSSATTDICLTIILIIQIIFYYTKVHNVFVQLFYKNLVNLQYLIVCVLCCLDKNAVEIRVLLPVIWCEKLEL